MSEAVNDRLAPVNDVICLSIPAEINPEEYLDHPDGEVGKAFLTQLSDMARAQVWGQWRPGREPSRIDWVTIEWLITRELEDVQEFQPAHDCEQCRLGNTRAEEFLREHPGRWIAMGNLCYTPRWEREGR